MMRRWAWLALGLGLLAACAPTLAPTPIPTQPLIQPTPTDTPLPTTPTATADAISASDVSPEPPLATSRDGANSPGSDPIASELVALAQRQLAEQLDLPSRRIHLVEVFPVRWLDTSLGCPQPDVTYPQGPVNGYRIVVSAGDAQFIFHSDFDRVIQCAAEDEVLPDRQATAEADA